MLQTQVELPDTWPRRSFVAKTMASPLTTLLSELLSTNVCLAVDRIQENLGKRFARMSWQNKFKSSAKKFQSLGRLRLLTSPIRYRYLLYPAYLTQTPGPTRDGQPRRCEEPPLDEGLRLGQVAKKGDRSALLSTLFEQHPDHTGHLE